MSVPRCASISCVAVFGMSRPCGSRSTTSLPGLPGQERLVLLLEPGRARRRRRTATDERPGERARRVPARRLGHEADAREAELAAPSRRRGRSTRCARYSELRSGGRASRAQEQRARSRASTGASSAAYAMGSSDLLRVGVHRRQLDRHREVAPVAIEDRAALRGQRHRVHGLAAATRAGTGRRSAPGAASTRTASAPNTSEHEHAAHREALRRTRDRCGAGARSDRRAPAAVAARAGRRGAAARRIGRRRSPTAVRGDAPRRVLTGVVNGRVRRGGRYGQSARRAERRGRGRVQHARRRRADHAELGGAASRRPAATTAWRPGRAAARTRAARCASCVSSLSSVNADCAANTWNVDEQEHRRGRDRGDAEHDELRAPPAIEQPARPSGATRRSRAPELGRRAGSRRPGASSRRRRLDVERLGRERCARAVTRARPRAQLASSALTVPAFAHGDGSSGRRSRSLLTPNRAAARPRADGRSRLAGWRPPRLHAAAAAAGSASARAGCAAVPGSASFGSVGAEPVSAQRANVSFTMRSSSEWYASTSTRPSGPIDVHRVVEPVGEVRAARG